jgi:group I intron endonuclease
MVVDVGCNCIYDYFYLGVFMTGIIYCYTNKVNGKKYIGQTINTLAIRAKADGSGYSAKHKFGKAIVKYGWDNFECEILETVETETDSLKEQLNALECFYISKFDTYKNGYNSTPGGSGKGKFVSAETRERIRQAQFNRQPASEETRRKISAAQKGKKKANTENYKKAAAKRKGIPPSDEARAKMSAAQKARVNSASYVHPNAGKHLSEETKAKLSAASLGKEPWNKGVPGGANCRKVLCIETEVIYDSIAEAARSLDIYPQSIGQTLHGRTKTAGGYHWEYVN